MARLLAEEKQKAVVQQYEQGRTLREIGASLEVSWMTIQRILMDHGIHRRISGRRRSFPRQRRCTVCKVTKPIAEFARESRQHCGYGFTCKECHREKGRKHSITKFGITEAQFEELSRKQGGVCAICGKNMGHAKGRGGGPTRLVIDHEHSTGRIRGLLCSRCNTAIGLFEDRSDLLEAAIGYLSKGR